MRPTAAPMLDALGHGVGVGSEMLEAMPCGQAGTAGFGAGRGVAAASAASRDETEGHIAPG